MNFLVKVILLIAAYGAGFYMGRSYDGGEDHVEDTLEHLKDLKTKGVQKGAEILDSLKAE